MIELLSCSDKTIVHEFTTLKNIQTIEHTNDLSHNFYFFGEGRHFLHYSQTDLKLYTFRSEEFKSIRKYRKVPKEFSCLACIKNGQPLFAAGTESGKVNIYNCLTPRLNVEQSFSCLTTVKLVDLDYSHCSKYLSAVDDDGRINVYGLQTSIKVNELPVEARNIPMVARFCTSKNIKLAIGTYTGKFFVHDLVGKQNIFEASKAHKDLCCDIVCPMISPNLIVSAGECTVNVYDLRKKKRVKSQEVKFPLSSITMSHCGTYLASGDLNGDISCFDMRNLQLPLISNRISKRSITRVAFIPPQEQNARADEIEMCVSDRDETIFEEKHSIDENEHATDSFLDFASIYPRKSDLMNNSNFSMRMSRLTVGLESHNFYEHDNTKEILTEVSKTGEDFNNFFVTSRRKVNRENILPPISIVTDVIKEESVNLDDSKFLKSDPLKPSTIGSVELRLNTSRFVALETSLTKANNEINDLHTKLPVLHIDLYEIAGAVVRACCSRDLNQEYDIETKLKLIEYLAHGEQFKKEYSDMIHEKQQDTLERDKILHPKLFQI